MCKTGELSGLKRLCYNTCSWLSGCNLAMTFAQLCTYAYVMTVSAGVFIEITNAPSHNVELHVPPGLYTIVYFVKQGLLKVRHCLLVYWIIDLQIKAQKRSTFFYIFKDLFV